MSNAEHCHSTAQKLKKRNPDICPGRRRTQAWTCRSIFSISAARPGSYRRHARLHRLITASNACFLRLFDPFHDTSRKITKLWSELKCACQIALSGMLWALADLICQFLENVSKENSHAQFIKNFNIMRLARLAIFGAFIFAPIVDNWFAFLLQMLPGDELLDALKRMACDQIFFAPCILSTLFAVISLLEGQSASAIQQKISSSLWPTLKVNWCYWPFVQTLNMWAVPPAYRLLFANCMSVPWNVFLAWQAAKPVTLAGGPKSPGIITVVPSVSGTDSETV